MKPSECHWLLTLLGHRPRDLFINQVKAIEETDCCDNEVRVNQSTEHDEQSQPA
jgi:hypothetical protein